MGALTDASELVTPSKQRKLVSAASAWVAASGEAPDEMAFTVAVVDPSTTPWTVRWIDDAFDG